MKFKILTIFTMIMVVCFGQAFSQSYSLESVDGGTGTPGELIADGTTPIVFHIRMTGDADIHAGITNGFTVYSEDGATWGGTIPDIADIDWAAMFDLFFGPIITNADGIGADTIAFGGTRGFTGTGLTPGFDQVVYSITIGPFETTDHNKTVCLDSSFYPPTGIWKWASVTVYPDWDGPHCYTVKDPNSVSAVNGVGLPTAFAISQNYPNPFNPTTTIDFDLPTNTDVAVKVYNVLGQVVNTLVDKPLEAGSYKIEWDGKAESGQPVASGVYFYKIVAGDFVQTKKMMMLK